MPSAPFFAFFAKSGAFDFRPLPVIPKSPLLAQRAREKWGTRFGSSARTPSRLAALRSGVSSVASGPFAIDTILSTGIEYGIIESSMSTARKITVEIPEALLEKAQQASGSGITQTIRAGLQLLAASQTYAQLRQLRGKVRFTSSLEQLKSDR